MNVTINDLIVQGDLSIEELKNKYNWIESNSFHDVVEMSKLTPKKI